MRFVIVSTARRGTIEPPEMLNEEGQAMAISRVREDLSRDLRAQWESDCGREVLPPKKLVGSVDLRVERMMRLARRGA